jgi:hypothetical protein
MGWLYSPKKIIVEYKKKVLTGTFYGRRPLARPRLRRADRIRRESSVLLNIRGWKRLA